MKSNSRQLFLNIFRGIESGSKWNMPCFGFWPETIEKWHEQGLPGDIDENNIAEYFNMDLFHSIALKSGFTAPYSPVFEIKHISEDEDTYTIIDKDGIKKRLLKKDKFSSMPQFLEYPVKGREDYPEIREKLKHDTEERIGMTIDELKEKHRNRDYPLGLTICGGFAFPRELMGLEKYFLTLHDDSAFIHNIMEDWLNLYKLFIADLHNAVELDFINIWEDMAYKNGPLISPGLYCEFIKPYLKDLVKYCKDIGVSLVMLDSDGNIEKLVPHFIDCGVDVLYPFEVQAGMDILKIRKQYPDLGIIGGIDKRILTKGKKAIKQEILNIVPDMYAKGRYIAAIDHSVPPDIAFEDFLYFVELLKDL